jgi:hypothetical protein
MSAPLSREPRWRRRLSLELSHRGEFESLSEGSWRALLRKRCLTSSNHDTVLALDWPHFCTHATDSCGGKDGWCYTFQGHQASRLHNRHVAMVDVAARHFPLLFGEIVSCEVNAAVADGRLPYPNLRYSGSGEVVDAYIPALRSVAEHGVFLWGFTRSLSAAVSLRSFGASVIFSCDRTTRAEDIAKARTLGIRFGYTSTDINDYPPEGTVVTFPVHRIGRVREVVDTASLCPKVLADFLDDCRPAGSCQFTCRRCHTPDVPYELR